MSTGPDAARPRLPHAARHVRAAGRVAVAATLGMSVSYIDRQTLAAIAPAVRSALAIDHTQFGWLAQRVLDGLPRRRAGRRRRRRPARRAARLRGGGRRLVDRRRRACARDVVRDALRARASCSAPRRRPPSPPRHRRSGGPSRRARRSAAYGLLFTGSSLGAMVAAPLALSLEGRYGFRAAFVGTAVVGLALDPVLALR